MSYKHFTLEERKYLQQLLSEGLSFRKIAVILERSPSTISREVKRNRAKYRPHGKTDNKHWYNHWRANNLYIRRRREQNRAALEPDTAQWNYIVSGLKSFWSPEEIAGRWSKSFPSKKPLCVSTIYRYIKLGKLPGITAKKHLRRHGVKTPGLAGGCLWYHQSECFPEIPTITASSLTGSSLSGPMRSATGSGSVIGKEIPFTVVLERD